MMIKINLIGRRAGGQATFAGAGGGGQLLLGKYDLSQLRQLPLGKLIGFLVFYLISSYAVGVYQDGELAKVDEVINEKNQQAKVLEKQLEETKQLERQMNLTLEDKKKMGTRVELIEKLLKGRDAIPRLLQGVSRVIPNEIWLSDIRVSERDAQMKGISLDSNKIYDFKSRLLAETGLFTEVQVGGQQQSKIGDTETYVFDVNAKRK